MATTSSYQFLTPDNLIDVYTDSKKYTESLTYPWFREYERIARNEVHPAIDKKYPHTTDGTTASVIRKTPHRIIQQLPTGTVISDKEDWLTVVAKFIYEHKIIPYANAQYDLIQKCWSVVEKALTFGSVCTYAPFLSHDGYFCPDLILPYWGDVAVQPGKLSDKDSNFVFMRSWWRTEDIKALIDKETKASKKSKTYESTWDVEVLQSILDFTTTKDIVAQTPIERERALNTKGGIELITGFQRGINSKFYTFAPNLPAGENLARTKINKDPRGEIPIQFMYADIDISSPLGRGVVELVGGLQNLMDAEMQMYQYNRALMLNPPIIKWGTFNKNRIHYEPNTIIDVGSDPNAKVEPLTIDTTAIEQFPNNYGLMKSQLLNLLAAPETNISATSGNANSKTPQGVQLTAATLSVDDNYMRKQFETWFERWSETAINLYFAERTGVEELQLDEETAMTLLAMDNFDPLTITPDFKIRINYNTETPALYFRVDPSSSQMKDDPQQLQIIQGLIEMVEKYPQLNKKWGGTINVDELSRRMVRASAIQDPEQIAPEATAKERAEAMQQTQKPSGFSPLFDKPKISIDYGDVEDPASRAAILGLAGAPPQAPLSPLSPRVAENVARQSSELVPEEQGGPNTMASGPVQPPPQPPPAPPIADQITPDHLLKAQQQDHQQQMDKTKLALEVHKTNNPAQTSATGVTKAPEPFVPPQESAPQPTKPLKNGIDATDQPIIDALKQAGASPEQIGQALAMIHHGMSVQQVMQMLTQGAK